MAYGTAERAWTYDEYVDKYEKLEKENAKLKEEIKRLNGVLDGLL